MLFINAFVRSRVRRSSTMDEVDELASLSTTIPEERVRERDLVSFRTLSKFFEEISRMTS